MIQRLALSTVTAVILLAAGALLLGASCNQGVVASGEVLKQVGKDWLAVNAAFVQACRPSAPTMDKATCATAGQLYDKFRVAYPLAMNLYESGVNANDAQIAGGAKAVIRSLAADGASLAIKVGLNFVKVN
jgi:hypothetical protein